jgi:hypothetical protein
MKPFKKVDFLKYRFLNRFKNDKEQRKLLVGEPLFSFIHLYLYVIKITLYSFYFRFSQPK